MRRWTLGLVIACVLAGCGSINTLLAENRTNLMRLSYGMAKDDVHAVMGQESVRWATNPYRTSMFMTSEGVAVEVFYYWTDPKYGAPDDALTPVVFNDGKVVGWGREFWYDYSKKIDLTVRHEEG